MEVFISEWESQVNMKMHPLNKGQENKNKTFLFSGFGIGSVIYSGLQFGQYFELSSQKDCDNVLKAVKPLLRIIFALMQMLFIFSYSNVSFERRMDYSLKIYRHSSTFLRVFQYLNTYVDLYATCSHFSS